VIACPGSTPGAFFSSWRALQWGFAMGIAARDWAWSLDLDKPSNKLVMLCLAEHANERGHCWPSVIRIMDLTGLSRRSVSRALSELKNLGLLRIVTKNYRNRYALAFPKQCANLTPPMSQIGTSDEPNWHIYEPSVEPKDEPSKDLGADAQQTKPTPSKAEGDEPEKGVTEGATEKEGIPVKVEEVVKTQQWKKLPKAKKDSVVARVLSEWRVALQDVYPDRLNVVPSMKEVGQVKHIVARLGPNTTKQLLRKVVADWEGFTYFAANGKAAPPEPHLGYVLAHVELATQWVQMYGTEPVPKKSKGLKGYLPPGV
jgi:hypothetical protein